VSATTQAELARRIGAANKSVIDQWETRQRTPSIVFWARVEQLERAVDDFNAKSRNGLASVRSPRLDAPRTSERCLQPRAIRSKSPI
jgi:hypothetical protein